MATEYPESYDAVDEKYESIGFEALTAREKAIYTIWWIEAEVNNGGFHAYFWNSASDHAGIALKSLNEIGAIKTAALLEKAIDTAFSSSLPLTREDRQSQLEIDEDNKMDKLDELDSSFYEYAENFHKMLNDYLAK